ncbi:hypothetical protein BDZ45DRAFT_471799 [Acephala macrosclerotiorum]|nr:hypothetical protein BDZ45DRAFT_471799 [Acephala macrosclerotiorum]
MHAHLRVYPQRALKMSKAELKSLSLEDILSRLEPITNVHYEPFKCEPKQTARALLPSSFPQKPRPFDYFTLFFTHDLFRTITTNTNRYASLQKLHVPQERAREWTDLLVEELYVFIGAIIYMGVHEEPKTELYWNKDFNTGPLHTIATHMPLCRFQQIKRYCHISCYESDERAGFHLPSNKIWWYKLEPLASSIQASSQRYYSPSSEVSIDELMVRCFDRCIRTKCRTNRSNKGTKSMELQIMAIYSIGFGALERRDYKILSSTLNLRIPVASFDPSSSLFHAAISQYTWTITLRVYLYL